MTWWFFWLIDTPDTKRKILGELVTWWFFWLIDTPDTKRKILGELVSWWFFWLIDTPDTKRKIFRDLLAWGWISSAWGVFRSAEALDFWCPVNLSQNFFNELNRYFVRLLGDLTKKSWWEYWQKDNGLDTVTSVWGANQWGHRDETRPVVGVLPEKKVNDVSAEFVCHSCVCGVRIFDAVGASDRFSFFKSILNDPVFC